jgi:hypothetical protein
MHRFSPGARPESAPGRGYDPAMGRRFPLSWTLALIGLSIAACGDDPSLPSACTREPATVRTALRAAQHAVTLDGVRLSSCVADASDAAELQAVGNSLVGAATALSDEARGHPGGDAELRLGYLIGAARRGAGREGGERTELVRRLEQEEQSLEGDRAAFRRGVEAGRRSG